MLLLPLVSGLRSRLREKTHLINAGGWIVGMFIVLQVMRLGTNVGLAHLLAPELLGTMALINTLRTGGELLTDIGIGQSIVNNKDGEKPYFYNTAWTLQIIRGGLLFLLTVIAVYPLSQIYDEPALSLLLPASALVFVISGFASPSRFLLQRRIEAKKLSMMRFYGALFSTVVHLGLAWYMQSVWALVLALLVSCVFETVLTFIVGRVGSHRLIVDRGATRAIFGYGKWIFVSTLIFYLASNFDRLYLAEAVSFAALGIYGIARTFADTAMNLTQYAASNILFPKVSTSTLRGDALRAAILPSRRVVVWLLAVAMAVGIVFADLFIHLAYDDRYRDAAFYLSILLAGGWFGMLAAFSESVLMGIGRPMTVAMGNAAKLLAILAIVPLVLPRYGMAAAVVAFSGVEAIRYLVLAIGQQAHRLSFWRQDVASTGGFFLIALLLREVTGRLGLTSGIPGWIGMTRLALNL